MSIKKRKIADVFAAIAAVVVIALLQVVFLHLFVNKERYDLASNFEANFPIVLIFNMISGLLYWVLFELIFKNLRRIIKVLLLAFLCTGSYILYAKDFVYVNQEWSGKLILIAICFALGNLSYPYLKRIWHFHKLHRFHSGQHH